MEFVIFYSSYKDFQGDLYIVMNAGIGIWVMRGWNLRSVKLSLFRIFLLPFGLGTWLNNGTKNNVLIRKNISACGVSQSPSLLAHVF